MHRHLGLALLGAAALALTGCGTLKPAAAAPARVAELRTLEEVCAALLPDASFSELRAALGSGVDYDEEGNLYIDAGGARALEPVFRERFTGAIAGLSLGESGAPDSSDWTLHGLRVGDTLEAVERTNGKPFTLTEDGADWNGGALDHDACTYEVSWTSDSEEPLAGRSDDPSIRARAAKISDITMRWRRVSSTTPRPALAPPAPIEARRSFKEVCDKLREDMSPEDLRAAFGARNTRDIGDDLWAVFPDDPARIFHVEFQHWDENGPKWRVYAVTIDSPVSTWALPNGLGMGDRLDAVERTAGGPFDVSRLDNSTASGPTSDRDVTGDACSYHVTLTHDRALVEDVKLRSDDPAFRSWRPRVSAFRIDWRWF